MIWKEFLTAKLGIWVNVRSNIDNALVEQWRKVGFYFRLKKVTGNSDDNLPCYISSLENSVAHVATSNSTRSSTIEKYNCEH